MRWARLLRAPWVHVLAIACAVAAAYGRTLAVPFYFDDYSSIRMNALVYRWQGLAALWRYQPNRLIGYLSFVLDYRLGHFRPAGYHIMNLLIHMLAAVAVYGLARGLLRTPRLRDEVPPAAREALPIMTALLFALHPLETEAVTYVVQRLAALAALFSVTTLAAYVQARLATARLPRLAWSAACLLACGLAFLSKENTATLPIAVVLVEGLFFTPSRRRMLATLAGAAGALALFWLSVALGHAANPLSPGSAAALSQETTDLTRSRYLATQMVVLFRYVGLFVLPLGLRLDYDEALRESFLRPDVLLGAAVHAGLLVLAVALRRRRPLVSFGLLFYYLAHAVESSVIPIRDLVFEHRTYLPNVGLCLVVAWLLLAEWPRTRWGARVVVPATAALLLVLGTITWLRNEQWRDPIAFWKSNAALAPHKARPWEMLGRSLLEANRLDEGLAALEHGDGLRRAQARGDDMEIYDINMIWALRLLGRYDAALARNALATAHPMPPDLRSTFYLNEGSVYFDQRRWPDAEHAYRAALALAPSSIPAMADLASACAQTGKLAEAESLYAAVIVLDPDDRVTRTNLAEARTQRLLIRAGELLHSGRRAEATAAYVEASALLDQAARANPADAGLEAAARRVRALIARLQSGTR